MQVEIVDTVEHRYIHPQKAADGTRVEELIPGRTSHSFILQMPDGKRVLAEVSEEVFESYRASI